jgi:hypothetical protein
MWTYLSERPIRSAIVIGLLVYGLYWLCRPVEIVAVHNNNGYVRILVKHFPVTERGRIAWYERNEPRLREQYGIAKGDKDGFFSVTVRDFAKGYQALDRARMMEDFLCFDDMPTEINCLEKDGILLLIRYKVSGGNVSRKSLYE